MSTSIEINDDLMGKLKQRSDITGLKISELVEDYLSAGLEDSSPDEVPSFVDFGSMNSDDVLEKLTGIGYAGYTDDVVQLKKDSRRVKFL